MCLCTDGVYRVFRETHCVATCRLLSTHWRTDPVVISRALFSEALICVVAKESEKCYTRVFQAMCRAMQIVVGLADFHLRVCQVHMDGHTAIHAAMKVVFPNACRALDWAHFTAACRPPKLTPLQLEARLKQNVCFFACLFFLYVVFACRAQVPLERSFHCRGPR